MATGILAADVTKRLRRWLADIHVALNTPDVANWSTDILADRLRRLFTASPDDEALVTAVADRLVALYRGEEPDAPARLTSVEAERDAALRDYRTEQTLHAAWRKRTTETEDDARALAAALYRFGGHLREGGAGSWCGPVTCNCGWTDAKAIAARYPAVAIPASPTPSDVLVEPEPVQAWPENHWREVWHLHCPKRGPMVRRPGTMTIEDGSTLDRFECLGCGATCFAGVDAQRRIVTRPDVQEQQ